MTEPRSTAERLGLYPPAPSESDNDEQLSDRLPAPRLGRSEFTAAIFAPGGDE